MGVNTTSTICYGIPFPEEFEFPWDNEKYDGYFDSWWIYEILGYNNPFEIYDKSGNMLPNISDDDQKEYYNCKAEFMMDGENKPTIEHVMSGMDSQYNYILAIPNSMIWTDGDIFFDPDKLIVTEKQKETLIDFCVNHLKFNDDFAILDMEPGWILSSEH